MNAELAEHAEKSPKHFFSAASAASALNVICSQTLKADTTYDVFHEDTKRREGHEALLYKFKFVFFVVLRAFVISVYV